MRRIKCSCKTNLKQEKKTKEKISSLQNFLNVLSEETRLEILAILASGEHCVCEIVAHLKLPQNLVSYHLKLLKEAGLVQTRREGSWILYRLSPDITARIREVFKDLENLIKEERRG